jgi:hypothetical protein
MPQRPLAVSFRTSQISSPMKDEDRPSHTLVDTKSPLSFGERVVLRTRMLIIDVRRKEGETGTQYSHTRIISQEKRHN